MKKVKIAWLSLAALVGIIAAVPLYQSSVLAAPADEIRDGIDAAGGANEDDLSVKIQDVVNILLFILGAIAVIMIVIGGIRYSTSNGDTGSIKTAKDTILYSVIGLIVAIMAYAIVNFVIDSF